MEVNDKLCTVTVPPPAIIPVGTSIYSEDTVSVMSYNILLPNSVDGWWVYKMYSYRHGIPAEQTTWEVRKELLEQEIKTANCDIVCFQEVCSDSFDSDFVFMEDMGYDQHEMYKKGRFRPATFWKSSRVSVVSPPMHRDRVLVIPFRKVKKEEVERSETFPQDTKHKLIEPPSFPDLDLPLYVANCHLQAGEHSAERRLRQMHDALECIRKDATKVIHGYLTSTQKMISSFKKGRRKKLQRENDEQQSDHSITFPDFEIPWACQLSLEDIITKLPVLVLGDMNCAPADDSSAHALLVHGEANVDGKINPGQLSSSSSKTKKQMLGNFIDAYEFAYSSTSESGSETHAPPTMICERLYGVITSPAQPGSDTELHELSTTAEATLLQMFRSFASMQIIMTSGNNERMKSVMSTSDVKRWLETINLDFNRGSEMRAALSKMILPSRGMDRCGDTLTAFPPDEEGGYLDWEGFRNIYLESVNQGKVWSVSWDMAACGYPVNPASMDVFSARFDRAYVSSGWLLRQQLRCQSRQTSAEIRDDELEMALRVDSNDNNDDIKTPTPAALVAVSDLGVGNVTEGCLGVGGCLPNRYHPSDHLPISLALNI